MYHLLLCNNSFYFHINNKYTFWFFYLSKMYCSSVWHTRAAIVLHFFRSMNILDFFFYFLRSSMVSFLLFGTKGRWNPKLVPCTRTKAILFKVSLRDKIPDLYLGSVIAFGKTHMQTDNGGEYWYSYFPVSSSHPGENCLAHKYTAGSQWRALISWYKQKSYLQPQHCCSYWNESVNQSSVPGLVHFPSLLINDFQRVYQRAVQEVIY